MSAVLGWRVQRWQRTERYLLYLCSERREYILVLGIEVLEAGLFYNKDRPRFQHTLAECWVLLPVVGTQVIPLYASNMA